MQGSERAPSTHRPATRSRIVAIPAQCPMISARHSVPPSERKGRFDICQLQRPAMMGESIAQPSIGRPLVSVSGPRYVSCAGTTAAGPSISDTSRIAELIDRVPHGNARLGLVPSTRHYRTCATVCLPSSCRGTVFCKNWLKMYWYRGRKSAVG